MDLGVEVAVLARLVGVLVVEEEEVVVVPGLGEALHVLLDLVGGRQFLHADQFRHAAVHGRAGDDCGPNAEPLLHAGPVRPLGEPAGQNHVGLGLVGEHVAGLREDLAGHLSRPRGLGQAVAGPDVQGRHAGGLRVGVLQAVAQPLAAKDHQGPVLLDGGPVDLDAVDLADGVGEFRDDLFRFLGWDAPGPAVGHVAGGVERAEVQPGRHVAVTEIEPHADGLQGAAANLVLERIVAEQAQVPRPAAGRHAGVDGLEQAAAAGRDEAVGVRGAGGLEFRHVVRAGLDAAQAVPDKEDDLAAGLDEVREVHRRHGVLLDGNERFPAGPPEAQRSTLRMAVGASRQDTGGPRRLQAFASAPYRSARKKARPVRAARHTLQRITAS